MGLVSGLGFDRVPGLGFGRASTLKARAGASRDSQDFQGSFTRFGANDTTRGANDINREASQPTEEVQHFEYYNYCILR